MTKIPVDKLWEPVHKSQRSVPPTIRRRAPSYPAVIARPRRGRGNPYPTGVNPPPNRVIARSEATWQSLGSTVQPKSPVRCCPEIAAASSKPRNDKIENAIPKPRHCEEAKPTWQSVPVQAVPTKTICHKNGLPRLLRSLAMTRLYAPKGRPEAAPSVFHAISPGTAAPFPAPAGG